MTHPSRCEMNGGLLSCVGVACIKAGLLEEELHRFDMSVERGQMEASVVLVVAPHSEVGALLEQQRQHRHAPVARGDVDGTPPERVARAVEVDFTRVDQVPHPLDPIPLDRPQELLVWFQGRVTPSSVDKLLQLAPHKSRGFGLRSHRFELTGRRGFGRAGAGFTATGCKRTRR